MRMRLDKNLRKTVFQMSTDLFASNYSVHHGNVLGKGQPARASDRNELISPGNVEEEKEWEREEEGVGGGKISNVLFQRPPNNYHARCQWGLKAIKLRL